MDELFPANAFSKDVPAKEKPAADAPRCVRVMPFDGGGRAYTYAVPAELADRTALGSLVRIPLGSRTTLGLVWECDVAPDPAFAKKIRSLEAPLYDVPVLAPDAMKLCEWIAGYYAAPLNSVLLTMLPAAVRRGVRPVLERTVSLARELDADAFAALKRRAKKQAELYAFLRERGAAPRGALPFSAAVVNAMLLSGVARESAVPVSRLAYADIGAGVPARREVVLNAEQQAALDSISASLDAGKFRAHLLHGVTGSGKTEVYVGAIRKVLAAGGSAIFLVPEVALTPQTVERLRSRLADCGTRIVVWHSNLSAGERFDAWMDMARGSARVLVGARSAIFAPLRDLRLIVVDEEHEPSFKQGETPFYHGRDVAVYRAHLLGAVCVLGSATPSLESFYNARVGKYVLNRILKRVDDRPFPPMRVIDMRREILHMQGQTTFSRPMLDAIAERLAGHEQCILFLNRRGYSRALICPDCGNVVECPHCSSALTFHREDNTLRCHLCDHTESAPSRCPACGSENVRRRGFGTQRAEEILAQRFPEARVVRLDADTMAKKNEFRSILERFRAGEIDVLLGTQMIAKGLDFPRVTLAGILDADLSLHVPDFRAAERTFQLLVQVAGRAGRGQLDGEVLVQTFTPSAPPIQFAKRAEFDEFLEDELERRREFHYPPERHLIRHVFRGTDRDRVEAAAQAWTEFFEKNAPGLVEIRGPAPCPTEKIQDNYRFHLWYFCARVPAVVGAISRLRAAFPRDDEVLDLLDVDPADVN